MPRKNIYRSAAVVAAALLLTSCGSSPTSSGWGGSGGDLAAVQAYATGQLPTWMRPSGWTVVDAIPLTVGGKADRGALIRRLTSEADPRTANPKENA